MKKLLILFCATLCLSAQAQSHSKKSHKKVSKAKTTQQQKSEQFASKNGKMKAHTMTENEKIETVQKADINAPQVNHGNNDNVPALSPSNGGK